MRKGIYHISVFHHRVLQCLSRDGLWQRGWKDQGSKCWAVRLADKCRENKTCHFRPQKSRAPIFRAVLCDNLLRFSCAGTQKPRCRNKHCIGTTPRSRETVSYTYLLPDLIMFFINYWFIHHLGHKIYRSVIILKICCQILKNIDR